MTVRNAPTTRRFALCAAALTLLLAASACSNDGGGNSSGSASGTLPGDAKKIMEKPEFKTARWVYSVADAETGELLLADRPDEMVFTASTAKEFVVGAVYDRLGPDRTLTTSVYATTPVAGGAVTGDLVLVASGDPALGGRNASQGRFDHMTNATATDHVYADVAPNGARVGDPLAGLDNLARQIAGKGVTRVDGNVVIDTRIWETFEGQEGPAPPIYVNDNLLDVQVTGVDPGRPATIEVTPHTEYFTVNSEVTTVAEGGETALQIEASAADPNTLLVRGTIPAKHSQLTIHRVQNGAEWARALFIEALQRAGVRAAPTIRQANDQSRLPAPRSYPASQEVASLQSPPLSAIGTMVLETSWNTGANDLMCLLAVELGSTDCTDGLRTIYDLAGTAGVDTDELFIIDGQGQDPASTTPRQISRWMQWARQQSWGDLFVKGQPVPTQSGSLAPYGAGIPGADRVAAKTGTSVDVDRVTGRVYVKVQSLSGYLTLDDGKVVVFGLSMSGATYPEVLEGIIDSENDVVAVAAAFQQALSKQAGR